MDGHGVARMVVIWRLRCSWRPAFERIRVDSRVKGKEYLRPEGLQSGWTLAVGSEASIQGQVRTHVIQWKEQVRTF